MSKPITQERFVKEYTGSPFMDHEVAELVLEAVKPGELTRLADEYLNAMNEFFSKLEELGYERG